MQPPLKTRSRATRGKEASPPRTEKPTPFARQAAQESDLVPIPADEPVPRVQTTRSEIRRVSMKGSRLEPDSGYVQHVEARTAFVSEACSALERTTAFNELQELAQHEPEGDLAAIETWARKWGVNAPCMRHAAKEIVDATRLDPADSGWRLVGRGEAGHEAWLHQVATWNELRISMSADDGVVSGTMLVPSERDPRVSQVVSAPLECLLEQDHILAPIATKLQGELLSEFLERARHHWQGRAQVGMRKYGFTHAASKPDLLRHIDWLVRSQIHKEPFPKIACDAGTTTDAVRTAIRRCAEKLDLELRHAPRGRPRHSRR